MLTPCPPGQVLLTLPPHPATALPPVHWCPLTAWCPPLPCTGEGGPGVRTRPHGAQHRTAWAPSRELLWPCAQRPIRQEPLARGCKGHPGRGSGQHSVAGLQHTAIWGTLSPGLGLWCRGRRGEDRASGRGERLHGRLCELATSLLTGPHVLRCRGQTLGGASLSPKPTEGGHPDGVSPSWQQRPVGRGQDAVLAQAASTSAELCSESRVLLDGKLPVCVQGSEKPACGGHGQL